MLSEFLFSPFSLNVIPLTGLCFLWFFSTQKAKAPKGIEYRGGKGRKTCIFLKTTCLQYQIEDICLFIVLNHKNIFQNAVEYWSVSAYICVFPCLFLGILKHWVTLVLRLPSGIFTQLSLSKCLLQNFQFLSPFPLALLDECHLELVPCQLEWSLTFQ